MSSQLLVAVPKLSFLDVVAKRAVRQRLAGLEYGVLVLEDGSYLQSYGRLSECCPLKSVLRVHDQRFYREVAFGGSIGAGEAYMQGYFSVDDLTLLMRIILKNRTVLDGMEKGFARLLSPLQKIFHWTSRNTRDGSRKNIHAHYDLGNEFFELMLDPTMMYSSAYFEHPEMSLEDASIAKMEHICKKLDLQPRDHLIEIGAGWGGFAIYAAQRYGCRVTTTTISRQQYEMASRRIASAGMSDRIDLLLRDYRDLDGQYDKLVSIEMLEAVGHQYYDQYFRKCSQLLKPEGSMMLQVITIADQRYKTAKASVDFIQRHIFPGSCIPSVTAISEVVTRVSDMRLFHMEDIGAHYVTTLKHWRNNFYRKLDQIRTLGYPETFVRMWEFYLCYCEGGFIERAIGNAQMLFVKPLARSRS